MPFHFEEIYLEDSQGFKYTSINENIRYKNVCNGMYYVFYAQLQMFTKYHSKNTITFCISKKLTHILLLISHGNICSRCGFISIHILCKSWAFKLLRYFVVKYNLEENTTLDDIEGKIFKLY